MSEGVEVVSDRMQGVDCPLCEDGTAHKHVVPQPSGNPGELPPLGLTDEDELLTLEESIKEKCPKWPDDVIREHALEHRRLDDPHWRSAVAATPQRKRERQLRDALANIAKLDEAITEAADAKTRLFNQYVAERNLRWDREAELAELREEVQGRKAQVSDLADAVFEGDEALRDRSPWIRAEDQLPEAKKKVLCFGSYDGVTVGKHVPECACAAKWHGTAQDVPTHWMPLPEPPAA